MTDEEYYESRCPYTDQSCINDWNCQTCEIEAEERRWMEMIMPLWFRREDIRRWMEMMRGEEE